MIVEIDAARMAELYSRGRKSFTECVNSKDNSFLTTEVNVRLESLILQEASVKIVFSQTITDVYVWEICFLLFDLKREIGRYTYYEDNAGIGLDDTLVFD